MPILCKNFTWVAALLIVVPALARGQASIQSAPGELAYVADDCQRSLFPSEPSAGSPHTNIDFCKELVIIDPAIMEALPGLSFRAVMDRLFYTEGVATDQIINAWAGTWNEIKTPDEPEARPQIANELRNAWRENRIKLIAVTNRLDLAGQDARTPLGEARLIYQLFGDQELSLARGMTIILEFVYPQRITGESADMTLTLWADKWHQLGESDLSKDTYVQMLANLIATFNECRNIRHIRTNEKYDNLGQDKWEFRQFEPVCVKQPGDEMSPEIRWTQLTDTPADSYRAADKSLLESYLAHSSVASAIQAGTHNFASADSVGNVDTIELGWVAQADSGSTWTLSASEDGPISENMLLMAVDTCNGCHADMQRPYTVQPQIWAPLGRRFPVLSSFMRMPIPLQYLLPECRGDNPIAGCINGSGYPQHWDEQRNRVAFMNSYLEQARVQKNAPIEVNPLPSTTSQ